MPSRSVSSQAGGRGSVEECRHQAQRPHRCAWNTSPTRTMSAAQAPAEAGAWSFLMRCFAHDLRCSAQTCRLVWDDHERGHGVEPARPHGRLAPRAGRRQSLERLGGVSEEEGEGGERGRRGPYYSRLASQHHETRRCPCALVFAEELSVEVGYPGRAFKGNGGEVQASASAKRSGQWPREEARGRAHGSR